MRDELPPEEIKKRMRHIIHSLKQELISEGVQPNLMESMFYEMGALDILNKMTDEVPYFKDTLYRYLQSV